MKRIVVIWDVALGFEPLLAELAGRAETEELVVFVLLARFTEPADDRRESARLFYRRAHARLDAVLERLGGMGIVSDGMAADDLPHEAVSDLLRFLEPGEVIVCRPRLLDTFADLSLERALTARLRETEPVAELIWLPSRVPAGGLGDGKR